MSPMPKLTKKPGKARYLFLLRHAKAAAGGKETGDFERPLSPRGEKDALKMAHLILGLGILPQRILCSPAIRTCQTLKALSSLMPGMKAELPKDLYLIGHQELLARLNRLKPDVSSALVIAHNPGIEDLALLLANPEQSNDKAGLARMQVKFPTGALAVLRLMGTDWKELKEGGACLEAFVRPKDLDQAS
jgi:phosphohistidine phosphatase